MTTAADNSSGGLNNPTSSVGRMKSSTNRSLSPMRMNNSCAVSLSYASNVFSSRFKSSIAYSKPTIDARSVNGRRLKLSNVAKICPKGLGNATESPNTGAVASNPSGDQKDDGVYSVNASLSSTPNSRTRLVMFG